MIFSLVAMTGLEKCCITSAYLQWLCHSGERPMARGPLVYIKSCLVFCSYVSFFFFLILLALRSPCLGKRELVCVLFVHLFIPVGLCLFPLPFGVGDWLQFVNVALPGPFFLPFCISCQLSLKLSNRLKRQLTWRVKPSFLEKKNLFQIVFFKYNQSAR